MKNCFSIIFLFLVFLCFGQQQKQFSIKWNGTKVLENDLNTIEVPAFDVDHFNYDAIKGLRFFAQWDANGNPRSD